MQIEYVFIGGPNDGQRMKFDGLVPWVFTLQSLPPRPRSWNPFASLPAESELMIQLTTYERVEVEVARHERLGVFVVEGQTLRSALEQLIAKYPKPEDDR